MITKEQVERLYIAIVPKNQIIGAIPVSPILLGDVLEKMWADNFTVDGKYPDDLEFQDMWTDLVDKWADHGLSKSLQEIEEWEYPGGVIYSVQKAGRTGGVRSSQSNEKQLTPKAEALFSFLVDLFLKAE